MKKLSCKRNRKNSVMQYRPICGAYCRGNCGCGWSNTNSSGNFQNSYDSNYNVEAQASYERDNGDYY